MSVPVEIEVPEVSERAPFVLVRLPVVIALALPAVIFRLVPCTFPVLRTESPVIVYDPPAVPFTIVILPPPAEPVCASSVVLLVLFVLKPVSEIFPPVELGDVKESTFEDMVELSPAESDRVPAEMLPELFPE